MKTLAFNWDTEELTIVTDATDGIAEKVLAIPSMFDKKKFLVSEGWANVKVNGTQAWYLPETELEKLEVMVAGYDFYAYQSDIIDTFVSSERELKKIHQMIAEVGKVPASLIWNKYAPDEQKDTLKAWESL